MNVYLQISKNVLLECLPPILTQCSISILPENYREAVAQRCSVKKVFFKISQNSKENTCARLSFLIKLQASGLNYIKKETLAQVFSCKFCGIFNKIFFT